MAFTAGVAILGLGTDNATSSVLGAVAFGALGAGLILKPKLEKQKLASFNKVSSYTELT